MAVEPIQRLAFDQFLQVERAQHDLRHELVGGQMFAMTGGSLRHSMCIAKIVARLVAPAVADGCRITQGDGMIRIGETAYYPDVMVACAEQVHELYEIAPCLVVEVHSPSTKAIDRREKLLAYQAVLTMKVVLLVDDETCEVTVFRRAGVDWTREVIQRSGTVTLACPPASIDVGDLFSNLPR